MPRTESLAPNLLVKSGCIIRLLVVPAGRGRAAEPVADRGLGVGSDDAIPLPSALAANANRAATEIEIGIVEIDELLHADAGRIHHFQDRPITQAAQVAALGRPAQPGDLVAGQKLRQRAGSFRAAERLGRIRCCPSFPLAEGEETRMLASLRAVVEAAYPAAWRPAKTVGARRSKRCLARGSRQTGETPPTGAGLPGSSSRSAVTRTGFRLQKAEKAINRPRPDPNARPRGSFLAGGAPAGRHYSGWRSTRGTKPACCERRVLSSTFCPSTAASSTKSSVGIGRDCPAPAGPPHGCRSS